VYGALEEICVGGSNLEVVNILVVLDLSRFNHEVGSDSLDGGVTPTVSIRRFFCICYLCPPFLRLSPVSFLAYSLGIVYMYSITDAVTHTTSFGDGGPHKDVPLDPDWG
jgi:hypothetical protein